ncbi:hypothetical protein, partial [uncultured Gordonia sp.]|uniref:hypothetical protein n=1 Tax=uncultured Gordonia sp. TaxID=198437 RepID=UPI00258541E4
MVEVRAACGEPRDRLRRCWFQLGGWCGYSSASGGLEASSLALLGTSTIGKDPPVVEVRAACGEPRDR